MTTPDITIKINSDEKGAIAGLRRLRSEVLNNEHGLKSLTDEGKKTSKALKDAAGVLGPEFQILGDRIDHITGALGDIKGAGLAAKASLAALVAVGGFEVGQMLGNLIFQTEKWTEELKAAQAEAQRLNTIVADNAATRAATMSQEELQREMRGVSESIQRQTQQVEESERAWSNFATADYWVIGENNRRKEVEQTKANIEAQKQLMQVYQKAMKQAADREAQKQRELELEASKALEEEAKARERAMEANRQLAQSQEDYLFGLEAELVKLRDGEKAYTMLTLAKKGFTHETAKQAIALQEEIAALREQGKAAGDSAKATSEAARSRVAMPGQVQATEARGLTRGIGMRGQDKILAATEKQVEIQAKVAKHLEEQNRLLRERLPREVG